MRVFSVDAADPFLKTLAERLLDGTLWPGGQRPDTPLALADARVFLPTRRAARALEEAFLEAAGGPTVLPRIEALGETDDGADEDAIVGELEARADLSAFVRAFAEQLSPPEAPDARVLFPSTGPDAVRLADDLLALFDQVETQEADWAALPGLVERSDLAAHWTLTSRFLMVASAGWQAHLTETGRLSPAAARIKRAEASEADIATAKGPVVVAGSTGSIPATRRLIRTIAEHPFGVVVLPGFDRAASSQDWDGLAEADDAQAHHQYGMKQLLDALELPPARVERLAPASARKATRAAVFCAALRPAALTDQWPSDRTAIDLDAGLEGLSLVEAEDERAEAAAAAVAMREALEAGRTTALVTPHRPLARRVGHALARWGIAVDDSAGEPLLATPVGVFARLVASVAAGGGAADWLGLTKHPLMAGADAGDIHTLEKLFRGPRLAPHSILPAMAETGEAGATFAQRMSEALAPLTRLSGTQPVATLAEAQAQVLATLMQPADSPAQAELARALNVLTGAHLFEIDTQDWPQTFETLTRGIVVRGPIDTGAVRILGPLEARLQAFDHVVIGGLNEGTWPAAPEAGPWMSRAMMRAFGLDLPERRIGLSAHDVFIAANAPSVTMTRAAKAGGEPTVASRWWQRLCAFAGPAIEPAMARGRRLVGLAEAHGTALPVDRPERPAPCPPLTARPTAFAVTEIAQLVRDPYAHYAKRILALRPLDPLEADPDARDRGILIHDVMHAFWKAGGICADDPEAAWDAACEKALYALRHAPEARALWGARLAFIGPDILDAEEARAARWAPMAAEEAGETEIAGVTLRGRIDRLDRAADGSLAIIDYKSGAAPSEKEVSQLLEPQLPLEAMLVRAGALNVEKDAPIGELAYVSIGQGRTPVAWRVIGAKDPATTAENLAVRVRESFIGLMAHYGDPQSRYLSRARVKFEAPMDGDYDHLARTAEWLA